MFLPDTNPNNISGWQWAINNEQLEQIKIPLIIYSVGYNYFRGHKNSELFKSSIINLVNKSSFFGLRNNGSVKAIQNIIPDEAQSKVVFQPCITTVIKKIYDIEIPHKSGKSIALNMAFDRSEMRFGEHKEKILRSVASAVKYLENKGYMIFYVCHCDHDKIFTPYLEAENISFKLMNFSQSMPNEIINFYNNIDVVLGMRGHAQMIPFGVNTEILSLGSHDKMRWFLEDIDAVDWYIELTENIENLTDLIISRFYDIHEKNKKLTHERLITQQNKLWEITKNNMQFIKNLIE